MEGEQKTNFDRLLELAEENNILLKQVRKTQKASQMMKAVYWVIIIVVSLGSYLFVQPYVKDLLGLYSGGVNALKSVQDLQGSLQNK